MPAWAIFTGVAILAWGLWGLVSKLAADAVPPLLNQILATIGLLPLFFVGLRKLAISDPIKKGLKWGVIAGFAGALGNLAYLAALSANGPTSLVTPLTAVYPLVTLTLAWLTLGERLSRSHLIGIALALAGLLFLNLEPVEKTNRAFLATWTAYALAALFLYGISAIFQKLSTTYIPAELCFTAFTSSFIVVAAFILATQSVSWKLPAHGWFYGILGGALNGLGVWATLAAYRKGGKASIVTPLAALYPVVTIILSMIFLGERPGLDKFAGIGLAVIAGVILSKE